MRQKKKKDSAHLIIIGAPKFEENIKDFLSWCFYFPEKAYS